MKNKDKIDPAFRALITAEKEVNKTKTVKKENLGKAFSSTKYECVIYTKNPKALVDKGITINSTFPTFLTAMISLHEIEQIASIQDVAFIEAAKPINPAQK